MAVWGLWTALLRPLSGEPFWETIERAQLSDPIRALTCADSRTWKDLLT
jgi:hypothetical protein